MKTLLLLVTILAVGGCTKSDYEACVEYWEKAFVDAGNTKEEAMRAIVRSCGEPDESSEK